jgi:hypothetical protein
LQERQSILASKVPYNFGMTLLFHLFNTSNGEKEVRLPEFSLFLPGIIS